MIAFFLLYRLSGSLEFAAFRQANPQPVMASVIFLLAFFGFGAKAGMLPLHGWLPRAHPAAPSHASALMSGVMVKIGIFGIIKVGIDLLGASQLWWGVVVLGFGGFCALSTMPADSWEGHQCCRCCHCLRRRFRHCVSASRLARSR